MRIPFLFALFGGIVFAAANVHTTTYVVGNLDNISVGAIGTVNLSDANAIVFRTRETTVGVAYVNINKAELGARVNPHSRRASLQSMGAPQAAVSTEG
jgi:hypothetical protein